MQVTIEVPDTVAAEAINQGLTPEDYVRKLISTSLLHERDSRPPLSQEQFEALLHKLSQNSGHIPDYSNTSFDREFIYDDHD